MLFSTSFITYLLISSWFRPVTHNQVLIPILGRRLTKLEKSLLIATPVAFGTGLFAQGAAVIGSRVFKNYLEFRQSPAFHAYSRQVSLGGGGGLGGGYAAGHGWSGEARGANSYLHDLLELAGQGGVVGGHRALDFVAYSLDKKQNVWRHRLSQGLRLAGDVVASKGGSGWSSPSSAILPLVVEAVSSSQAHVKRPSILSLLANLIPSAAHYVSEVPVVKQEYLYSPQPHSGGHGYYYGAGTDQVVTKVGAPTPAAQKVVRQAQTVVQPPQYQKSQQVPVGPRKYQQQQPTVPVATYPQVQLYPQQVQQPQPLYYQPQQVQQQQQQFLASPSTHQLQQQQQLLYPQHRQYLAYSQQQQQQQQQESLYASSSEQQPVVVRNSGFGPAAQNVQQQLQFIPHHDLTPGSSVASPYYYSYNLQQPTGTPYHGTTSAAPAPQFYAPYYNANPLPTTYVPSQQTVPVAAPTPTAAAAAAQQQESSTPSPIQTLLSMATSLLMGISNNGNATAVPDVPTAAPAASSNSNTTPLDALTNFISMITAGFPNTEAEVNATFSAATTATTTGEDGSSAPFMKNLINDVEIFFNVINYLDSANCLQKLVCTAHSKQISSINQNMENNMSSFELNIISAFNVLSTFMPSTLNDNYHHYLNAASLGLASMNPDVCSAQYPQCNYSVADLIGFNNQIESGTMEQQQQ